MAQGGPYSREAKYGFDPAEAQAAAADPAMSIVGAGGGEGATTRRVPQVPIEQQQGDRQFSLGIDSPMYGWSVNQDDLGQGDVQYSRTDQFITPVAEQKLPFGAIAARQQGTSQRRAQLEDAKKKAAAAFDPYKDISDPAAQHQRAFSNYLNKSAWPSFVQGVQDGLGTTREGAIDYIANNPEGRMMARQWSQKQDAIAKESAGMTDRSLDILARIAEGKTELPREEYEAITKYVNNVGENDTPQEGYDEGEFLWNARGANEAMSLVSFQDKFLDDFDKFAQQQVELGKAKRLPGGRYEITDEEWSKFEPYKQAMAAQAAEMGIKGGNQEAIQAHLDKIIQNKVERKNRDWAPLSAGSSGSGSDDKKVKLSVDTIPWNPDARSIEIMSGSKGVGEKGNTPLKELDPRKGESSKFVRMMTGTGRNLPATVFTTSSGGTERIYPVGIQQDPVYPTRLYIVGESATDTESAVDAEAEGDSPNQFKKTDSSKRRNFIRIPVEGNEKLLDTIMQGQDWMSPFGLGGQQGGGRPAQGATPATTGPKAGAIMDGYRFKGGDPADSKNWVKQ